MLILLYRRLINNKWLFLCLLLGAISTTAIAGAIPMYANGILQKVLTKDLENAHLENNSSPGKFSLLNVGDGNFRDDLLSDVQNMDKKMKDDFLNDYDLPILQQIRQLRYDRLTIQRASDEFYNTLNFMAYPTALDDYENHVQWTYGKAPTDVVVEGVYEVAMSDTAMKKLQLMPDTVYDLNKKDVLKDTQIPIAKFKVVGVFTVADKNELFWADGRYDAFTDNILFTRNSLESLFDGVKPIRLKDNENIIYFDYHQLYIGDIGKLIHTYLGEVKWSKAQKDLVYIQFPVVSLLNNYDARQKQLRITLWILMIPLLIIMAFYAVLVSNLIVKNDKNEIAMLKSRGAKRYQIFLLYLGECGVIGLAALVSGPWLSIAICRLLGASNGFLEFVSRKAMVVKLSGEVLLYQLIAITLFSLFVLLPVIKASRVHIVQYKRSLLDDKSRPLWQRLFLDFIILGVSIYGLQLFKSRQDILGISGLSASEVKIDPLLFFISTLFILGASLIFLRVYPWLVRIIFKLGEKHWHPVMYFSLVNVGKSDKNLQAIMLFLILVISFGLINANQARTINVNTMDRVSYTHGADVVIEPYNNQLHAGSPPPGMEAVSVPYVEPDYRAYSDLPGVEELTKVYQEKRVRMTGGQKRVGEMSLMGITPNEFGNITWFRNDLLPHHINDYLNLLAQAPKAILLSSNMEKEFGLKVGDSVIVDIESLGSLECTVYAFVDYFPGYMPLSDEGEKQFLGIVNASYIQDKLPLHPYEIWIKKAPDALDHTIADGLTESRLKVETINYAQQDMIKKKNDPMLLGTNGILTMCFIIEMFIAAIGFIIFWVLSIRERSLKFGIFRAIGMPMSQIGWIMIAEQILVSGVAIILGFVLGSFSSQLFIPLLELVYSSSQQVPKFRVLAEAQDYYKVLAMTMIMLLSGLIVLYRQVKQIKVNQVIKLGEDS